MREFEEGPSWPGPTSRADRAKYFRRGVKETDRPKMMLSLPTCDVDAHEGDQRGQAVEANELLLHPNDMRLLLKGGRHPAEAEFNEKIDYSRQERDEDEPLRGRGAFNSQSAQVLHRRYQTASQLHGSCHQTCFKYLKRWAQQLICRFGFPVNMKKLEELNADCATTATVVNDRDAKRRVRWRCLPPRNNAYVNNTPVYVRQSVSAQYC